MKLPPVPSTQAPLERNWLRYLIGVTTQIFARYCMIPLQARKPLADVVEVSQITISHTQVPAAFHGYRIVQLTDLHLGTWLDEERLRQIAPLVNRQNPDLVAVTGDLISYLTAGIIDHLIPLFRSFTAPDGIAAVRGNHDCWAGDALYRSVMAKGGVHFLENERITIHRADQALHICGLGTAYYRLNHLNQILEDLPPGEAAIMLAHEPDTAEAVARSGRFFLQLSGHSHGGQIVLPGAGSPWLPRLGRLYPRGLYQLDGMYLYTCRGVGTSSLPLRLGSAPEIAVITLQHAEPQITG